ncbi:MAG: hypothetical protein R6U84_05725 [Candidatus Cloacimonadales bacterium]
MRKMILMVALSLVLLLSAQSDFEAWKKAQSEQFENFKTKEDAAFYEFLQENWSDFAAFKGEKQDVVPKPQTVPEAENEKLVEPEEAAQAKVVSFEVEEAEKEENIYFAVDKTKPIIEINYFGLPMDYNYEANFEIDLSNLSEDTIANFWMKASNSDYEKFLEQLQTQKQKMNLNDWGYCLLVDKIGQKVAAGDEKLNQLFNWFILLKSGYDSKIGYNENDIYILLPSANKLFGVSYIIVDEQRYYAVSFSQQKPLEIAISTYEGSYPDADDLIDMSVGTTPNIQSAIVEKELKFSYAGQDYTIPVKYDANAAEFFRNYPQTDLDVYFEAPLSDLAMSTLSAGFTPILQGQSEPEAVNILLRFVQTAFQYQTDDEQFGREKSFFSDEVLFYPASDCEDRSILFSYLVRNILKLNVVGLDYPGHIAAAVNLNTDLKGDYILHDEAKYIISDPTYINANLGMTMPQFQDVQPKIIELSRVAE